MSSLHHDRLLVEGSAPETGAAATLTTARGTSRRPAAEKAISTDPTQRPGTAQRSGSAPTTTAGTAAPARARRAAAATTGKAATRASRAKAAPNAAAKVTSAKAATVTTATAKAATANAAPAAKPATAVKAAATDETGAQPAGATTPAAERSAPVAEVRPTPHKRTPVADAVPSVAEPVEATPDVPADAPAVAATRRPWPLRRRPPSVARRPSLYLAAALIAATTVGVVTTAEPEAQATATVSQSVSVAQELGLEATPGEAITDTDAAELLSDLAVSRNVRDAEQAAAAEVQAEADRIAAAAAAEAARPKAVMPVNGARLTSPFGARWGTLHAGIDLAAPMMTPEYAAMDGVVLEAGPASGYGLVVYIQHENGDVTVYGHMEQILVSAGQVVKAGDTIALVGNRGQSTGPHLHFEVRVGGLNGEKIDPIPWLRDKGVAI